MEEKNDIIPNADLENQATDEETTLQPDTHTDDYTDNNDSGQDENNFQEETDNPTETEQCAKRKKSPIMLCTIIAACILFLTIATSAIFLFFFNTSITGTYVLETNQEQESKTAKTYFFIKEDGKLGVRYGSLESLGTYETTVENNSNKITLNYSNSSITYNYQLEGNKIFGTKILLTDENGSTLTLSPATYEEVTVTPIEKVKKNSKLIGTWELSTSDGNSAIKVKYTFNDDNSFILNYSQGRMKLYGYYSAEKDKINIKYKDESNQDLTHSMSYSFNGNNLVLDGAELKKVSE